jgi:hypothetical protein
MQRIEFTTFAAIGKRIDLSIHVFYWPTEHLAPRVDRLFTFSAEEADSYGWIDDIIVQAMRSMWMDLANFVGEQPEISPVLYTQVLNLVHRAKNGLITSAWAQIDDEYSSRAAMSFLTLMFSLNTRVLRA